MQRTGTGRPRVPQRRGVAAFERIREMILDGELQYGTPLSEAELVRQLGMSRTPVREALHKLEVAGYIVAVPGVGYAITEINERDLINAYKVRAVLEGLAAETAAESSTRMDIARLEDLYDEMAAARDKHDDQVLARLNSQFHQAIAEASRNHYVVAMLKDVQDIFERFRTVALSQPLRREESHIEHGQLIEAIRARDKAAAKQVAIDHVHRALAARSSLDAEHRDEVR